MMSKKKRFIEEKRKKFEKIFFFAHSNSQLNSHVNCDKYICLPLHINGLYKIQWRKCILSWPHLVAKLTLINVPRHLPQSLIISILLNEKFLLNNCLQKKYQGKRFFPALTPGLGRAGLKTETLPCPVTVSDCY